MRNRSDVVRESDCKRIDERVQGLSDGSHGQLPAPLDEFSRRSTLSSNVKYSAVSFLAVMATSVSELHRYAVKGFSSDRLESVDLSQKQFSDDRRFALRK